MAKKKKYYVVWEGHETGIFDNWTDCQRMIKNYSGARYKSFKTLEEAQEAFGADSRDFIGQNKKASKRPLTEASRKEIIWESLAVDAACSGNPGAMEYRGVDTKTGYEFFRQGPFPQGTNNVGEFLALVHGLALLKQKGSTMPIYSDSKIAIGWVQKKVFRSKLQRTRTNARIFELVDRALIWLKNNSYDTEILKWKTKEWGEIPADFGRK
ncbi:MAG: viroplasmin family protein [Saprospiraceae bacterium]